MHLRLFGCIPVSEGICSGCNSSGGSDLANRQAARDNGCSAFTYPSLAGGKLEDVGNACWRRFVRTKGLFISTLAGPDGCTYHLSVGQNTVQIRLGSLSSEKVGFQFCFPSGTFVVISRGQSPVPNHKVRNLQWSVQAEQIVNVHAHYLCPQFTHQSSSEWQPLGKAPEAGIQTPRGRRVSRRDETMIVAVAVWGKASYSLTLGMLPLPTTSLQLSMTVMVRETRREPFRTGAGRRL